VAVALPITLDPIFSESAWALIFGLFVSTVFTPVVIPVVYHMAYALVLDQHHTLTLRYGPADRAVLLRHVRVKRVEELAADGLLARHSRKRAGRGVECGDVVIQIDRQDAVRDTLHDRAAERARSCFACLLRLLSSCFPSGHRPSSHASGESFRFAILVSPAFQNCNLPGPGHASGFANLRRKPSKNRILGPEIGNLAIFLGWHGVCISSVVKLAGSVP